MTTHELAHVALDDKYTATDGRGYLSGIQRWRDHAAGLNTAGFVSGYRGAPRGGIDKAFWDAQEHLDASGVKLLHIGFHRCQRNGRSDPAPRRLRVPARRRAGAQAESADAGLQDLSGHRLRARAG